MKGVSTYVEVTGIQAECTQPGEVRSNRVQGTLPCFSQSLSLSPVQISSHNGRSPPLLVSLRPCEPHSSSFWKQLPLSGRLKGDLGAIIRRWCWGRARNWGVHRRLALSLVTFPGWSFSRPVTLTGYLQEHAPPPPPTSYPLSPSPAWSAEALWHENAEC